MQAPTIVQRSRTGPTLDVRDFGPVALDGRTDNARALQAALDRCPAGGTVVIPSGGAGFLSSMVAPRRGGIAIVGASPDTRVIQTRDARSTRVGDEWKASAFVLVGRGVDGLVFRSLRLEQDDSFAALSGYTTATFFAPIQGFRADGLDIDEVTFACRMGRGLSVRGGNQGRIGDRVRFLGCGATLHVGFAAEVFGYDRRSDVSTFYSPIGWRIGDCEFRGSSTDPAAQASLHLSGCNHFTVGRPRFLGLDAPGPHGVGLSIHRNDFGVTDEAGRVLDRMTGTVGQVEVEGRVNHAIRLTGYFTRGRNVRCEVTLDRPRVAVDGHGLYLDHATGVRVVGADIRATGSPLLMSRDMSDAVFEGGRYVGLRQGQGGRTIYVGGHTRLSGLRFDPELVQMAPADDFAWNDNLAAAGPGGESSLTGRFVLSANPQAGDRRPVQVLGAQGRLRLSCRFEGGGARWDGRILASVNKGAGELTLELDRNLAAPGRAGWKSRGVAVNGASVVHASGNDCGPLHIVADEVVNVTGGRVRSELAGIDALSVTGAQFVHVRATLETAPGVEAAAARFTDCCAVTLEGEVRARSRRAAVQMISSGSLRSGARIANAGGGGDIARTGQAAVVCRRAD